MRQIELINQLLDKGLLTGGKYRKKRFHLVRNDRFMEKIGTASKQNPSRDFIYELHELGRKAGQQWIDEHIADVGVQSSFNIDAEVAMRLKS